MYVVIWPQYVAKMAHHGISKGNIYKDLQRNRPSTADQLRTRGQIPWACVSVLPTGIRSLRIKQRVAEVLVVLGLGDE